MARRSGNEASVVAEVRIAHTRCCKTIWSIGRSLCACGRTQARWCSFGCWVAGGFGERTSEETMCVNAMHGNWGGEERGEGQAVVGGESAVLKRNRLCKARSVFDRRIFLFRSHSTCVISLF